MNWQQIISLFIVAVTVLLLVRSYVRRMKQTALGICTEDCGCPVNELVKNIPTEQLKHLRDQQRRVGTERHTG